MFILLGGILIEKSPRKRIINEFAFPYGAPFKKVSIHNSFGILNQ